MSKDAYYFSHDSNARNDEKVLELRMQFGWEGYGIYWAIIEKLREASDYKLKSNFNLIAFDLRVDNQKVKSIVTGFGLFSIDEENGVFYSKSLIDRMKKKEEKSNKARNAANHRWSKEPDKQEDNADAMQTHSNGNAIKERKVKEIKERKEIFKEQVFKYRGEYTQELLDAFFDYWSESKPGGRKMRFEMQRTWNLNLRLKRWKSNEKNFGKNTEDKPKTRIEQLARRHGVSN